MEKAFRGIQRICGAGLDSVTLRREIAQRISAAVPHEAYAFSTCDPDTGLMVHTIAEGVPHELGRCYVEHLYPQETATRNIDAARSRSCVVSMMDTSPDVRAAFHRYGIGAQMHLSLVDASRLWGTWCLMRGRENAKSLERGATFLRRIAPVVTRGLMSAAQVDRARQAIDPGDASTAAGVVVLDGGNHPVVRTPAASRLIADLADSGLGGSDDLPLSILGIAARLRRHRGDLPEEVVLRIRGSSGRWYALRGSLAEPDASGRAPVVVVIRPTARHEIAPVLTSLYGLSRREREVVAAVVRGEPTKCIAATLGVSPYTVVEHLDRACRKIGVRGRKALVAKLFVDGYAPGVALAQPRAHIA